ncbi:MULTISPECIES: ABC transporter substrate-binding protein [Mycolicibacterium]|uniref:Iron chelate uptake ABC transporter, solute-binding protein n=1 Tax=Mycolicibacterium senegalense TaxID=1796 RepID=A0A378WAX9_9MYCO|nr:MULTISPECIES: ABC transporter substrate-binding protein [Mycolicibacterium]MCV7337046.1 ABC transporter substrate-binding protein [Mycolicibacterium senegalense]MDR7292674.1 iron complex transport system substrate-binding protein [Mycolicibacterium senegalense]QZA24008.1 ABC transporter substrate-binding protein [Mycolicibacterium senegalense]CDP88104.1 lipoprotein [Mycolicibacterium farcinogenes]SUA29542.1 iron chelate uptake ABC transporter, solute-binding protein [Mycolicibacterium seneg
MAARWLIAGLASALVVSGCASTAATETALHTPPGFPVTVDNCGVSATYDRPPTRAVALNQHAIEVLLALGLDKSMVGTSYLDDRILPEYQAAYDRVPVLAEEYPSYESLLAVEPDFVYGGWDSAFDEKEGRGRQRLADAGVHTYLNIEDCRPGPVSMSTVDDEIRNLGTIFGVQDRAEQQIEKLHRELARSEAPLRGVPPVRVAVYDSGEATVFTSGGKGIGNLMIEAAGGVNVFPDVPKVWGDVSFEQFAERAPEAIVIYDYGDQPVEDKKRFLTEHPLLQHVPAIADKRFAVLPLSSVVVGVRVGRAVDALARQLHPDRFV